MIESGIQVNTRKRENIHMDPEKLTHFPLFIPMENKRVVVVGGGQIAKRRISTLMKFSCHIHVISPEITNQISQWVSNGQITCEQAAYYPAVLDHADLVVAATNVRAVNQAVGMDAKSRHQFVCVSDKREECNFYFPSIIEHDHIILGLSSQGRSPSALAEFARNLRKILKTSFPQA